MSWFRTLPLWMLGGVPACGGPDGFACADSVQCISRTEGNGQCQPSGFCSFPDATCPSTQRYGEHASEHLAGTCVEPGGETGTGTGTTTGETDTGASTSTGSESGTGPACGEVGDRCLLDEDCCNDCMRCDGGTCTPRLGEQASCDECMACDNAATCQPSVGAACGTDTLECSDYLWGSPQPGQCVKLQAGLVTSTCDSFAQCVPPTPMDCPFEPGEDHILCSQTCAKSSNTCVAHARAEDVDLSGVCLLNQKTEFCDLVCSNGSGSALNHKQCDHQGLCVTLDSESCGAYLCEDQACNTSCTDSGDCSFFASCDTSTNTCGNP